MEKLRNLIAGAVKDELATYAAQCMVHEITFGYGARTNEWDALEAQLRAAVRETLDENELDPQPQAAVQKAMVILDEWQKAGRLSLWNGAPGDA